MAYIRGNFYLWQDGEHVHIWSHDGYDGWDESIWHEAVGSAAEGAKRASGVAIPFEVADAFAVMRVAQLAGEGKLSEVVDRAIRKWKGNGGCKSLCRLGDHIREIELGDI